MEGVGISQATVHEEIVRNVAEMVTDADRLSKSVTAGSQRRWQILPLIGWSGDPLDIPGIKYKFDRTSIGSQYADCLSGSESGTVADAMALKLQNDWLAAQERAFRLRHATSVRCAVHAAARRSGHAKESGVLTTGIQTYLENIIKGGS